MSNFAPSVPINPSPVSGLTRISASSSLRRRSGRVVGFIPGDPIDILTDYVMLHLNLDVRIPETIIHSLQQANDNATTPIRLEEGMYPLYTIAFTTPANAILKLEGAMKEMDSLGGSRTWLRSQRSDSGNPDFELIWTSDDAVAVALEVKRPDKIKERHLRALVASAHQPGGFELRYNQRGKKFVAEIGGAAAEDKEVIAVLTSQIVDELQRRSAEWLYLSTWDFVLVFHKEKSIDNVSVSELIARNWDDDVNIDRVYDLLSTPLGAILGLSCVPRPRPATPDRTLGIAQSSPRGQADSPSGGSSSSEHRPVTRSMMRQQTQDVNIAGQGLQHSQRSLNDEGQHEVQFGDSAISLSMADDSFSDSLIERLSSLVTPRLIFEDETSRVPPLTLPRLDTPPSIEIPPRRIITSDGPRGLGRLWTVYSATTSGLNGTSSDSSYGSASSGSSRLSSSPSSFWSSAPSPRTDVIIKVWESHRYLPGRITDANIARDHIANEWRALMMLSQPKYHGVTPHYMGLYYTSKCVHDRDVEMFVAVMADAGHQVNVKELTDDEKAIIVSHYDKIHAAGILHCDVTARHWLRDIWGNITVIDFENASFYDDSVKDGCDQAEWDDAVREEMATVKVQLDGVDLDF
ncbi:hypothetical protein IAR55_007201 [Kwoniella newhampshirensis]|uniref:Protein kinase domain-containing protein n=1 Tax=Kwoniella newhampshirensis TaxID=1651941 RepID=A0AAW0YSP3_9TREE